ncbi:hypothetical protein B0H14DRAFT_3439248 [Mycena olivaceomarginata]|nr:hypothetical protein B0H14DRAFT_3439248 [Mycena olivaceomarginata]
MSQVTGGIYETLKQVTEMLEKGSKTRFFASAHVQLASDAAAFAPTVNFDVSGSKPLIGFFRLSSPFRDSALTTFLDRRPVEPTPNHYSRLLQPRNIQILVLVVRVPPELPVARGRAAGASNGPPPRTLNRHAA